MKKDYKKMFDILEEYLKYKVDDIDTTILQALENRKNGKLFTFREHLKGFIYAQLSALVSWKKIKSNLDNIDNIFCQFDKNKLKQKPAKDLIAELTKIKCNDPYTTKNQMYSLKTNIETFERIEKYFNSMENFITHQPPIETVKLLADTNSTYKLKYSGIALVCEYLRNVGIDIVKPDIHLKRILGVERLNLVSSKSDYTILAKCKELSEKIGINQIKMDYLLWNYCAKGYGEICTKKPKCEKCVINEFCNNQILKKAVNIVKKDDTDKFFNKKISINKEQNSQIIQEIEEFLSNIPIGYVFSTGWFKDELSEKYKRPRDSYIPSDYCYNRTNRGIQYEKQPHYFLYIERGKYQYKGKNYNYQGTVETDPRY